MLQEPKELIDVGEIGNTSTGDILYDGGGKINNIINALYNTFGDYRLSLANNGIGSAILHATGYYQKHPRGYYTQPIDIGSMHDINVADGTLSVRLPKAVQGEGVVIANFNGSISDKLKLIIMPNLSDDIDDAGESLIITKPYTKVTLFCTKTIGSRAVWSYKTESLFGDLIQAVQGTFDVTTEKFIEVAPKTEYKSIKFMITGTTETEFKSSEVMVYIDSINNLVHHTEYAVVKSEGNDLFSVQFSIDNDIVYAKITTTSRSVVTLKSIESIKHGVAK